MRKITFVALGLTAVSLTTPVMGSPEKPTLLETAAFLITGVRAEYFKAVNDSVLVREYKHNNNFMEISEFYNGHQEVIALASDGTPDNQCRIIRSVIKGTYDGSQSNVNIRSMIVYNFNRLDGNRSVESKYLEGYSKYMKIEVMTGSNSNCNMDIIDGKAQCNNLKDDIAFRTTDDVLMDQREKAWKYLYSNFCEIMERPF